MKYVYSFIEGNKDLKDLLGGKGANLAEMKSMGLPVPDGFTITTSACNKYYLDGEKIDDEIIKQIMEQIEVLERNTNKKFGDLTNPLLVSVRSGAPVSMPGMMDTILNLGLNDSVAESFSKITNNPRFVYDSYRRFIQMFSDVVMGYPKSNFERIMDEYKKLKGVSNDSELDSSDMIEITNKFKTIYKELSGSDFPQDPRVQLIESVKAVFRSWNNERAIIYRKMNDIKSDLGTAVNVQEMVYGNLSNNSATGVAFTRNPATGENKLYGEFLINAQGEDVVAGIRTPLNIDELKNVMPDIYNEFLNVAKKLENHYRDMQDMEFTIEDGKLYMLQTRNGKRTASASIKVAVDLVKEGLISKEEAILRVEPKQLDQLLHKVFDSEELKNAKVIAEGLAASPGAGVGRIYFNASDLKTAKENKLETILVRLETSPEDIEGMNNANGILTVRGGMTSHAAVVARGMGKCCVSGCGSLIIDEENKTITTKDGKVYKEGDYISIDGSTGKVYDGIIKTIDPVISGDFKEFMSWVDSVKRLKVRANADTPEDAITAFKFGAEGIGLCRTEHMFFKKDRIFNFRKMILAKTYEQRVMALSDILPYQRSDFEALFETMNGYPVVIRYLDPPLHEFIPKEESEIKELALSLNMSTQDVHDRISSLKEFNPMMGHRGSRLDITYPEIAIMQTKALIEAAINVSRKGVKVIPEIMLPLIGDINEFRYVKTLVINEASKVMKENNYEIKYQIGTMIEIPRACIISSSIAREAQFYSFGTNDLTQLTYGFSRDDASKFLNDYYEKKIFDFDPFTRIDEKGVGSLVNLALIDAKRVNSNMEFGICGEHGGETNSIAFFDRIGLDYVSCSPYRVPIARLAAAQSKLKNNI